MKFYLTKVIYFLVLLLIVQKTYSNSVSDSLQLLISHIENNTEKVRLLNDLSRNYLKMGNYVGAIQISKQALTIAKQESYYEGITDAYRIIAYSYLRLRNYTQSLKHYFLTTRFFENIGNKTNLIKTYQDIALIYNTVGDPDLSIKYNKIATELIHKENSPNELLFISFRNYSTSYFILKKYQKAILYARKSLAIGDEKQISSIGLTNNQLGSSFWQLHQYDTALKYYTLHLELNVKKRDSTEIARAYCNIGTTYNAKGEYYKAISFYEESLSFNQVELRAHTYLEYVDAFVALNNINKASYYYSLARAIKGADLKELSDGCRAIENYYRKVGLPNKALLYADLKDSLKNEINKIEVANSKANLLYAQQMEVVNNELLKEKLKEQIQKSEMERAYNYALLIIVVLLLVILGIIIIGVRKYYIKKKPLMTNLEKVRENNRYLRKKIDKDLEKKKVNHL